MFKIQINRVHTHTSRSALTEQQLAGISPSDVNSSFSTVSDNFFDVLMTSSLSNDSNPVIRTGFDDDNLNSPLPTFLLFADPELLLLLLLLLSNGCATSITATGSLIDYNRHYTDMMYI
ncbi:hypothetical protein Hanom_Chr09g00862801 [Helianthus anomalus]